MSKELLEQAIERLTELRDSTRYEEFSGWLVEVSEYAGEQEPSPVSDDPLFLTLHRTIEPILDMLEHCVQWLNDAENNGLSSKSPIVEVEIEPEVNIAKAILGVGHEP